MGVRSPRDGEQAISVIVPTYNEEQRIGPFLADLEGLEGLEQIVVVDGQSTDGTVEAARRTGVAEVVPHGGRGRASQMNHGAELATGGILLFLHADVQLPRDAAQVVRKALSESRTVAGAFRTWTVSDETAPRGGLPTFLLHLADIRSRLSGLPYGDQALFLRAGTFREIGGFPDLPLMEDLELSRRLRSLGRIRTVRQTVRVSGRRFLARPIYYTVVANLLPLLYRLGVPPGRLAPLYEAVR